MNGHKSKFRKSALRTGPKCWLCLIVIILLISLFISLVESIRSNRIRPKVRGRGRGSRWWGLAHPGPITNSIETRYSNSIIGAGLNGISVPIRKKQRRLIRDNPRVLIAISKGIKMAIDECQYQFKDRRWNCPTLNYLKGRGIFGKIVQKGCRETAFVYAITSAGVAHAVASACREGIFGSCACDYRNNQRPNTLDWDWRGCSDNIEYGYQFAKEFVDAAESGRDLGFGMNLHNNEAGRLLCLLILRGTGRQLVLDPNRICRKAGRLKGKQAMICDKKPDMIREIARGAEMGKKECEHQFCNRHWNCSSAKRSMRRILMRDTRETGFVHAITAAGVTYAISRACSLGTLLDCSCHLISKSSNSILDSDHDWRGCSDNIEFGYKKSKEFMGNELKKRFDIQSLVLRHNYEAGRLSVKNYMRTVCKCHGMSGSCTVKTCWRKLPLFSEVGLKLKEKFDGASKVIATNDGKGFIPEGASIKMPGKEDLVYSEESPDFCEANKATGSLGTKGRECNATSKGVDGCELLCCGRGYKTFLISEKVNCHCRFHWCCEVMCDICTIRRTVHRCL